MTRARRQPSYSPSTEPMFRSASTSLRGCLGRLPIPLLPTRFGVVGFVDTGRVWLVNESSDTWHTSYGGGLLLQPVLAPVTVHVIAADSKEGTRFYFGLGLPF